MPARPREARAAVRAATKLTACEIGLLGLGTVMLALPAAAAGFAAPLRLLAQRF